MKILDAIPGCLFWPVALAMGIARFAWDMLAHGAEYR